MLVLLLFLATLSARQQALVRGARTCLGDVYDSAYYAGGPPPRGRGACPEVIYWAWRAAGRNLQDELERDLRQNPRLYPSIRDRNIDYRWCPNLIVFFRRHVRRVQQLQPGDVVFWSLTGDGVADHVGLVSDRRASSGRWLMIHNFPPGCTEEDVLNRWMVVGRFRG